VRVDHLGLIAASVLALPNALFAGSAPPATATISAAAFDASVSPTPTVKRRGRNNQLTWSAVTVSSGAEVRYIVLRHRDGGDELTCVGSDSPVVFGGVASCTDRRSDRNDEYSVTAYVVGPTGSTTWSLPESDLAGR
jgi:hypothetical protein